VVGRKGRVEYLAFQAPGQGTGIRYRGENPEALKRANLRCGGERGRGTDETARRLPLMVFLAILSLRAVTTVACRASTTKFTPCATTEGRRDETERASVAG